MLLTDLQRLILEKKGFDLNDNDKIEKFLNPNWERDVFDASKIKDIDKGVERIKKAITNNEKIVIYADYDCDGIPGAVVLNDFLEKVGYKNFSIYIPHRHNEGYGLNKNAIQRFIDEKVSLMITVDLGITNIEEINLARENGIDIILTDHHLPIIDEKGKQIIPQAFAVINTKQDECEYEEKFLCGASTAWKLVNAFLNKYRNEFNVVKGWEKWLLDMVGIATIADLVPLKGENRLFAKYGLEVLKKSKRPGLQKILFSSKVNQKNITEDDIAFYLAPRINSASRIAEPIHAFYALLQNEDSVKFAMELERYNTARKEDTKSANDSLDYEKFKSEKIVLVGSEEWTPGIIGLVASKIVERTGKTTFVWGIGEDKNILKGSVRAGSDGYNVVHIMTEAKNILSNFGGHEMAGGFAIHKNNLESFINFLREYGEKNILENLNMQDENILEENFINLKASDISRKLFDEVKIFAPFGVENEKPVFRIILNDDEKVLSKRFGKSGEHLEILIGKVRCVEFFANKEREEEIISKKEFLVNVEWDNFRGDVMVRLVK